LLRYDLRSVTACSSCLCCSSCCILDASQRECSLLPHGLDGMDCFY
jgi:hypothetical protein